MALILLEGFEAYGTTNGDAPVGVLRKWTLGIAGGTVRAGRIGGKSLRLGTNQTLGANVPATQTLIVGFAFRVETRNTSECKVLELFDGASLGINIRQQTDGEWSVYRGTTHLATSSGNSTALGGWCYVELRVKVASGTSGEYELRVNGSTVLSNNATNTQGGSNASTSRVHLTVSGANASPFDYDDFYLLDETGAVNNTFKGSVKVQTIFPDADSAVDCTPSTGGDNFALVDDNPVNDDTDYVTGAAADIDLYDYGAIDATVVHGVMVNTICRETDASPLSVKQLAKSGTTTGEGAADAIGSTTYVHRGAIFEQNPDTTAAWTPTEVNAAQFGFEIE